jgi:hypothetical protein
MIVKNMGSALRFCIPQMIGQKLGNFWELMKPLVDFKYEVKAPSSKTSYQIVSMKVIETRMNSMFELATQEEIDALRTSATGENSQKDSEELELDDLEARMLPVSNGSLTCF